MSRKVGQEGEEELMGLRSTARTDCGQRDSGGFSQPDSGLSFKHLEGIHTGAVIGPGASEHSCL